MTIEEAIKQFREDAENNRADLDMEFAKENEQVANWLEELKAMRNLDKTNYSDGYEKGRADAERDFQNSDYWNDYLQKIISEAKADAIEEFVKSIEKNQTMQDNYFDAPRFEMSVDMTDILKIAEQLKEG